MFNAVTFIGSVVPTSNKLRQTVDLTLCSMSALQAVGTTTVLMPLR